MNLNDKPLTAAIENDKPLTAAIVNDPAAREAESIAHRRARTRPQPEVAPKPSTRSKAKG